MKLEDFKKTVAYNLVWFRRKKGLTQIQLAEILNYSDKAISKWERGESLPDAYTLYTIAKFYNVGLDDFLVKQRRNPRIYTDKSKLLIAIMSAGLSWVIATILFVVFSWIFTSWDKTWVMFIYAIPVSFIVLTVFSSIWGRHWMQLVSNSGILWGLALSFFFSFMISPLRDNGMLWWLIFIVAIPIQVILLLWYYFRHIKKPKVNQ